MAINTILKPAICEPCNCKTLQFSDLTGLETDINPTGYAGGQIPENATAATLTIILGNETSYIVDLFATGFFPTEDTEFVYTIPNNLFGYSIGDTIPDQMITFIYTVTFDTESNQVLTQTIYKGLICNTKCCVLKMPSRIDWTCCDCSKQKIDEFYRAYGLLIGLESSACVGSVPGFTNTLTQLNKICSTGGGCGCH